MKFYEEFKAGMEMIQQQVVEAKKSECANMLKDLNCLVKELSVTVAGLKNSLAEGRGRK